MHAMNTHAPKSLALLRLTAKDGPIYFVVKSYCAKTEYATDARYYGASATSSQRDRAPPMTEGDV